MEKIHEHNQKAHLTFKPGSHDYYVGGKKLQSVTETISKYFPFDEEKVSQAVAQKKIASQEEILQRWEQQKQHGNEIHDVAHRYCQGKNLAKKQKKKIQHAIRFLQTSSYTVKASEIQIFSEEDDVAGTVDLLLYDEENQRYYVADWKTCKNEIRKDKAYEKAKDPFHYLPNNKFHKYSMQLSTYQTILEKQYDIQIFDTFIIHLKRDKTYDVKDTMNLQYESRMMLDDV